MNNFNEFVKLWQGQTKKVKVKKEYSHLLFLIVYHAFTKQVATPTELLQSNKINDLAKGL